jgi:hypothetical protein
MVFPVIGLEANKNTKEKIDLNITSINRHKLGEIHLDTSRDEDKICLKGINGADVKLDSPKDSSLEVYIQYYIWNCSWPFGIYIYIKDGNKIIAEIDTSKVGERELSATLSDLDDGDVKNMKIGCKLKYLFFECEKRDWNKELRLYYPWAHLRENCGATVEVSGSARKGEIAEASYKIYNDGLGNPLSWEAEIIDGDRDIIIEPSSGLLDYNKGTKITFKREIDKWNDEYSATIKVKNTDTRKYQNNYIKISVTLSWAIGKNKPALLLKENILKDRFPMFYNIFKGILAI